MNEIFKQWQPSLVKAIVVGFFLFAIACDDEDSPEVDDVQVQESLVSGTWRVTYFFNEKDETIDYDGFVFVFNDNGTAIATKNSTPVYGSWSTEKSSNGTIELILGFGLTTPLEELTEDWTILESSDVRMKMEHISNSATGDKETLILEKN